MFPTNPDLADILGRTDLDVDNFKVFDFLDLTFLDFQVPRSQISQISRRLRRTTVRSQPDPSPNAPREQIRRKGPCCNYCTTAVTAAIDLMRLVRAVMDKICCFPCGAL